MKNKKRGFYTPAINNSPKDKQILVDFIRKTIEKKTGFTINEFIKKYNQIQRYRIGLFYFQTTNKAICTALLIPVEAGTRRKRKLEDAGLLKATSKKLVCPYTKAKAYHYTTNSSLFDSIINSKNDK